MFPFSYGMFDATFCRDELQILLARLAGVADVIADLRESGWPCTISGKIGHLELQIVSRPLWARGHLVIGLNPQRRQHLATTLETLTHPRIWLHAEPDAIRLEPSPDDY